MKVIREGNIDTKKWWVGKRITCAHCGRTVELEDGDENRWNWVPMFDDSIQIQCEQCGKMAREVEA